MNMIDILGYCAAILTTIAFLPQALSSVRSGKTDGLSLPMYVIFSAGVALWLGYGLAVDSLPIILANLITLGFALIILGLIIRNKVRPPSGRERMNSIVVGESI